MNDAHVVLYITMLKKLTQENGHVYLSTSCLHDKHHYCRSAVGQAGPKVPGVCKFCKAPCICPCHKD